MLSIIRRGKLGRVINLQAKYFHQEPRDYPSNSLGQSYHWKSYQFQRMFGKPCWLQGADYTVDGVAIVILSAVGHLWRDTREPINVASLGVQDAQATPR